MRGRVVDIEIPHSTVVPFICAEPLARVSEPHARALVLGGAEEQVTLEVELDSRERALVAVKDNGLHICAGWVCELGAREAKTIC